MDAAEDENRIETRVGERQTRRIALDEDDIRGSLVVGQPGFEHVLRDIDSDRALGTAPDELQCLAAAAADLGDSAKIPRPDDLQQCAVERGGVFDRVGVLQMRDVIGGDAVVMRALGFGFGRSGAFGSRNIGSPDLYNDLPLRPAFFEIRQRLLRLIEREYLVNHRSDVLRLEQFTDLCELPTVWTHEQE